MDHYLTGILVKIDLIAGTMAEERHKKTVIQSFLVWRMRKLILEEGPELSSGGNRRKMRLKPCLSAGPIKAMPMVVMEKCGVPAPKSVRLLTSMALVYQSPPFSSFALSESSSDLFLSPC